MYKVNSIPQTYKQAISCNDSDKWLEAMQTEFNSLTDYNTFTFVPRPPNTKIIPGRWVYAKKNDIDGVRYKARWVAKGFTQSFGVNYAETYAPLARMTTIRIMLFLSVQFNLIAHQMDVCTAYLNSHLDHTIYMSTPDGFCNDKSLVCKLNKSLYGLKQSAKLWNDTINDFFLEIGLTRNKTDMCLYSRKTRYEMLYVILWIDDIIVLGSNMNIINNFKSQLKNKFKVKDHGPLRYFLGIEISMTENSISLGQAQYCAEVVSRFHCEKANPGKTPMVTNVFHEIFDHRNDTPLENPSKYRALVGSLIYLQQVTRPDISFATNLLAQKMANPTKYHYELGLKVIRYLKKTQDFTLTYTKVKNINIIGFVDSDWANDKENRKSVTGFVYHMSLQTSPICWTTTKQDVVAQSTTEAEYVALNSAVRESGYLQELLDGIELATNHIPVNIHIDNEGAYELAHNPCHHPNTKHISYRFHLVRDLLRKGFVRLTRIPGHSNPADGFTKPLGGIKFESFIQGLNRILDLGL